MIITALQGGLGNQMFQYACGKAVAERHKTTLKIDTRWFSRNNDNIESTHRTFDLLAFDIPVQIASAQEISQFIPINAKPTKLDFLIAKINRSIHSKCFFKEKLPLVYDPYIRHIKDNTYLSGYWQSELYFQDIEEELRKEFLPRAPLSKVSEQLLHYINESEWPVSLHVRRGDYLKTANTEIHGILPHAYYQQAIEIISSKIRNPTFFIFTDDIFWAKNHFKLNYPCRIREHSIDDLPIHEDMWLMSKCKFNITANSSYSWWGAWLNNFNDKIVIAPKNWVVDIPKDATIIPFNWISI